MTKTAMFAAPRWVFGALLGALLGGCVITTYQPVGQAEPLAVAPGPDQDVEEQAPEPPPPLPLYEQPPCPVEGYIWTPGVWRWGAAGYFWVPGTWVAPPAVGMLWTPGYWALVGAAYVFHRGYWGRQVGYYGGINYGGGYGGDGYRGGRWVNNRFQYNTAVSNVNATNVRNVYRETVASNLAVGNINEPHASYVGPQGTAMRPSPPRAALTREVRYAPTQVQAAHHAAALGFPPQNAARNEGRPPVAATPHPGAFLDRGVTAAKPVGPVYHPQRAQPRPEKQQEEKRGHESERPR